ncbi:MAG: pyridoxal-phosphate dependent enzyme [Planctomycetes bacterium]|nr:pyridoxal-phosphate dependent enzyme [Planctomycetota bacterium]MCP4838592.1 pyridoxal-phosphate dependent enzyme [Planctomycetota bacterium]
MTKLPPPSVVPPPVFIGLESMIGNTPMIEVTKLDTGPCRLLLKLESQNPGNSIKDRIAVSMIDQAESAGTLQPGGHIVEATAGNTGIALALVGRLRGYHVTVVVPDKMSEAKIAHLRALGAEVAITRSDVQKGHPEYYQEIAAKIASDNGGFYVNQFENPANATAHAETTGPEIWAQTEGQIDAFIGGIGSGGTLAGAGAYLRSRNPNLKIILADPEGSMLTPLINDGEMVEAGSWLVEGIGEDFVPDVADLDIITEAIAVSDCDTFLAARDLLRCEGILGGSSTGTLLAAAMIWCRRQTEPLTVVTFVCDHGSKYLSRMFNDHWMRDQGFLSDPMTNDLRDLIGRRHESKEDFTLTPNVPIAQAVKMMRLYDVSQMAVLNEDGHILGILDESDVLLAVTRDTTAFASPVSDYMSTKLQTVSPELQVESLLPIFQGDRIAIVVDQDQYLGLITRIDLINYLRKKMST